MKHSQKLVHGNHNHENVMPKDNVAFCMQDAPLEYGETGTCGICNKCILLVKTIFHK